MRPDIGFGSIGGYKIVLIPKNIQPKMELDDNLPVSESFRKEFNEWLLDFFGAADLSPLKKGEMVVNELSGHLYIRDDDWPRVKE